MSDADCTPGREPRSVAASISLLYIFYLVSLSNMYMCIVIDFTGM